MGITKTKLFTTEQNELAVTAKALAHPARVAIIQHIIKSDTCINNELVKELGLAQATISQHLKELQSIGLLQGTVEGKSMCYCINSKKWNEIKKELTGFFAQSIDNCSDSCC
jgi:predicted transcriptional regulator